MAVRRSRRVGGADGLKRPKANDRLTPPLIKPDGRFSRIRLSEGASTAGLAPAVTVNLAAPETWAEFIARSPWPSPVPLRVPFTRTQVPRLRSPPVMLSGRSTLLRRTPTAPAARTALAGSPPWTAGRGTASPRELSRLTLATLPVLSSSLTPPRFCAAGQLFDSGTWQPSPIRQGLGSRFTLSRLIR